ncbi:MAG: tetratricopeptide repeat protein [Flavobacteriales bacterium]|nr:tetratricopeptide repeat protein [Flavobacteriales bacterium]
MISDGESFEDNGEQGAKEAAKAGILVYTIGLGSAQGAPIPVRVNGSVVGFKKDKEGQTVMSKLDEATLNRIAEAGKGEYVHASSGETGVTAILGKLRAMDQSELGTFRYAGQEDRFQYFLAAGCIMVLLGLAMGERTFENPFKKRIGWSASISIISLLLFACTGYAQDADRAIRQGNVAMEKGDAAAATRAYEQASKDERGVFNLGNAWYDQDSLARAQQAFETAAAMAKGEQAQARAYHNLGNAQLQQGRFSDAVKAYKEALKRAPNDADTRYNLAFAQKNWSNSRSNKKTKKRTKIKTRTSSSSSRIRKTKTNRTRINKTSRRTSRTRTNKTSRIRTSRTRISKTKPHKTPAKPTKTNRPTSNRSPRTVLTHRMQNACWMRPATGKNVQDEVRRKLQPKPDTPKGKDW